MEAGNGTDGTRRHRLAQQPRKPGAGSFGTVGGLLQSPMNLIIKHNKRQNEKNQNNRDTLSATKKKIKRKEKKQRGKKQQTKKATKGKWRGQNRDPTDAEPSQGAAVGAQRRTRPGGSVGPVGASRRPATAPRLPGRAWTPGQPHARSSSSSLWGSCSCEGSHSWAAGGPAPREGIPGGRGGCKHGWAGGLQHQHPRARPAKPWCSRRLCPTLLPCCPGPRAAADGMATKPHTLANTTVEPAAYQEPRTSSPAHDPHPEGSSTPAYPERGTSAASVAGAAVPGSQQALMPAAPLGSCSSAAIPCSCPSDAAAPEIAWGCRGGSEPVDAGPFNAARRGTSPITPLLAVGTATGHPGGPGTPPGAYRDGDGDRDRQPQGRGAGSDP